MLTTVSFFIWPWTTAYVVGGLCVAVLCASLWMGAEKSKAIFYRLAEALHNKSEQGSAQSQSPETGDAKRGVSVGTAAGLGLVAGLVLGSALGSDDAEDEADIESDYDYDDSDLDYELDSGADMDFYGDSDF